ncbi:hypothetical protein B5S31_g4963 [[Candida] boidinii]|nr:hypothetical protein B5S31_g4963 [[Candida] boidinii]
MSIASEKTIAALPSTTRNIGVHLSYDPKSDRIAYASGKSIYLRSVSNPSECTQFIGHTYNTTVAKFSPSGFYVASGDESGNVKVWDSVGEDMIVKGDFPIINGKITDIAWDADSQRIIAVGDGKERYGHCFTYDSGNTIGEISGHSGIINAVSIRQCRPYRAATVADDAALVFLQGPPFKFNSSLRGNHTSFVRDVAFSKDGAYIVSVGADRQIVVYDGKTGEFIKKIDSNPHEGGIFALSWLLEKPDCFVTCSADGSIKLWNVTSGELLKTWSLERKLENQILGVISTKDYIIGLTYSGDLYYFNESSESPVNVIYGHQKSITSISKSPESESGLFTGSYDGRVVSWDLKEYKASLVEGEGHKNLVVGIVPQKDGSVSTTAWDDTLKRIVDGKFIDTSSVSLDNQPVSVSSIDDITVIVTEESLIYFENLKETKKIALNFTATSVDVSKKFITVGNAKTNSVTVYDHDLKEVKVLPTMVSKPSFLKISPKEDYLAAGDASGKIVCYDLSTFAVKTSRWAFHTAKINSIAWNEDNDHIVSGSLDTNFIVYSVSKPMRNIKKLNAHKEGVNAVCWIDNKTVASAGTDAALKLWKVTFPDAS